MTEGKRIIDCEENYAVFGKPSSAPPYNRAAKKSNVNLDDYVEPDPPAPQELMLQANLSARQLGNIKLQVQIMAMQRQLVPARLVTEAARSMLLKGQAALESRLAALEQAISPLVGPSGAAALAAEVKGCLDSWTLAVQEADVVACLKQAMTAEGLDGP